MSKLWHSFTFNSVARLSAIAFACTLAFLSPFSHGQVINVEEEIKKAHNSLEEARAATEVNETEVMILANYLGVLKVAQEKALRPAGACQTTFEEQKRESKETTQERPKQIAPTDKPVKETVVLEETFLKQLALASRNLDQLFSGKLSPDSVYDFTDSIKQMREATLKDKTARTSKFQLKDKEGKLITEVLIEVDEATNTLIDFGDKPIAEGATKFYDALTRYPDWSKVARARLKDPLDAQAMARMKKEQQYLALIANKAKSNIGLPVTLRVGPGETIQQMAQTDLFEFQLGEYKSFFSHHFAKNRPALYGFMKQLSTGLVQLHKLGILHADTKPENITVAWSHDQRGEAVYRLAITDFDLSEKPADLLLEGRPRPLVGTPEYFPPETHGGWIQGEGNFTLQDTAEYCLRGDVFSMSIVFYNLTHSELLPWFNNCPKPGQWTPQAMTNYRQCRNQLLGEFLKAYEKTPYQCLDHLLLRGLDADPVHRLSSKQLQTGILHCSKRHSVNSSATPKALLAGNKGLKLLTSEEVAAALHGQKVGAYVVYPVAEKAPDRFRLAIGYVTSSNKLHHIVLDVDPAQGDAVLREIEHLKRIGTLGQPAGEPKQQDEKRKKQEVERKEEAPSQTQSTSSSNSSQSSGNRGVPALRRNSDVEMEPEQSQENVPPEGSEEQKKFNGRVDSFDGSDNGTGFGSRKSNNSGNGTPTQGVGQPLRLKKGVRKSVSAPDEAGRPAQQKPTEEKTRKSEGTLPKEKRQKLEHPAKPNQSDRAQ